MTSQFNKRDYGIFMPDLLLKKKSQQLIVLLCQFSTRDCAIGGMEKVPQQLLGHPTPNWRAYSLIPQNKCDMAFDRPLQLMR